jgi:hypothetical protein
MGACLVLGGSQAVATLSGVDVCTACFLIPLVAAAYVIAGGLRSTFIADSSILFHRHLRLQLQQLQHQPCRRLAFQILRLASFRFNDHADSRELWMELSYV